MKNLIQVLVMGFFISLGCSIVAQRVSKKKPIVLIDSSQTSKMDFMLTAYPPFAIHYDQTAEEVNRCNKSTNSNNNKNDKKPDNTEINGILNDRVRLVIQVQRRL